MAILKFRIYFEEDDSIYRDVVVRHTQSFLQLHQVILKAYEFDSKHQATFYRSNDNWQRGREISLEKYDKAYKAEPDNVALGKLLADVANQNGNPAEASEIYAGLLTKDPQNADILASYGASLIRQERYAAAHENKMYVV